ncbi:MAG: glycosyltransferase family 4 protein [Acidimicrobiales bacterium]
MTEANPGRVEGPAVALDVSAVPRQPAGAGRYVVELARALAARRDVGLTLVTRSDDRDRWADLCGRHSLRIVSPVPPARPLRLAYERLALGRALGRLAEPAIEVYHGPHYTMPSLDSKLGSVVTIHDLTWFDHPEWHERAKVPVFKRAIKRAARDADVLICVSQTTADRLSDLVPVSGRTVIAPHGVDHETFRPRGNGADEEGADEAELRGVGLEPDAPFVAQIGTLEPRKGVVDLISAFELLAVERPDLQLVLAGTAGWGAEVESAVSNPRFDSRIHRLGWVSDKVVVALMRSSGVTAYVSHEEGFGLPALEAMACGGLLVTTAGTEMAEFSGDVAWTATAGDAASIAGAIRLALSAGPDERRRRVEAGMMRAARFTWERTAEIHVSAYELASNLARDRH